MPGYRAGFTAMMLYGLCNSGSPSASNFKETFHLKANESINIPLNSKHRLGNPGTELLIIFEIQFGKILDEKDILRHDDRYGRL